MARARTSRSVSAEHHHSPDVAGKTVTFRVEVKEIGREGAPCARRRVRQGPRASADRSAELRDKIKQVSQLLPSVKPTTKCAGGAPSSRSSSATRSTCRKRSPPNASSRWHAEIGVHDAQGGWERRKLEAKLDEIRTRTARAGPRVGAFGARPGAHCVTRAHRGEPRARSTNGSPR